ncbi:uncharacterized protein LOC133410052 [Phycodurus eques]|uniref:uncharacterized protein LOC133410052 n=1 Tax=Phycodurus eques TaxID=693459 RepID=UPI002ACDFA04|nr:uncharacterized protein LOC133410052 [Phycodurus eques]
MAPCGDPSMPLASVVGVGVLHLVNISYIVTSIGSCAAPVTPDSKLRPRRSSDSAPQSSTLATFPEVVIVGVDEREKITTERRSCRCFGRRCFEPPVGGDVYFAEGQKLTLQPAVQGPIRSIEWKRNRNLLAEWYESQERPTYFGGETFRGRISLNVGTGTLEIADAVATDAGEFTLALNDVSQDDDYIVKFVRLVPEPEMHVSPVACSAESENCTLHCGGNTNGTESLTYFWRTEPGTETVGESYKVIDRTTEAVRSFVCAMENPLSRKESKPFDNPFYLDRLDAGLRPGVIAGLSVGVLVTVAAVCSAVFLLYRKNRNDVTVNGSGAASRATDRATELPERKPLHADA